MCLKSAAKVQKNEHIAKQIAQKGIKRAHFFRFVQHSFCNIYVKKSFGMFFYRNRYCANSCSDLRHTCHSWSPG